MKERSIVDFMCGAVACVSMLGFYMIVREGESAAGERKRRLEARWELPAKRRRRSPEDFCRHCAGTGECASCEPAPCRVCRGRGIQPRDESLVPRLNKLWGTAA